MGAGVVGHVVPVAHVRSVRLVEVGPPDHGVEYFHRPDAGHLSGLDRQVVVHSDTGNGLDSILPDVFEPPLRSMFPSAQGITQRTYGQSWPEGSDCQAASMTLGPSENA